MPLVGVVCQRDGSLQSFEHCIQCHENRQTKNDCHAPVMIIKSMRDNGFHRQGAGISASTLISCPRAVALESMYPYYESVISGYNKGRGTWTHAMFEADPDPPEWVIRERRLFRNHDGIRVTGKPDEIDTKYKLLVDYKSKDNLPTSKDAAHEFQFNVYAWLLREGYWTDTQEKADVNITAIIAHYVTWKTKPEKAWKKMLYPVWSDDQTSELVSQRLAPIVAWKEFGVMPKCDPFIPARYWKCQCTKIEEQLDEQGIAYER